MPSYNLDQTTALINFYREKIIHGEGVCTCAVRCRNNYRTIVSRLLELENQWGSISHAPTHQYTSHGGLNWLTGPQFAPVPDIPGLIARTVWASEPELAEANHVDRLNERMISDMEAEALRFCAPSAVTPDYEKDNGVPKTRPKNLGCECEVMRGDEHQDNLTLRISFNDRFGYYASEYRNGRACMVPTAAALIEAFPYLAAPISLSQAGCGWDGQPSSGSKTLKQLTLDLSARELIEPDQLSKADNDRFATQLLRLYRFTPDELEEVVKRFRRPRAELKDGAYAKLEAELNTYYAAMLPRFYDEARKARNNIRKTARLKSEWKRLRGKKPTVNNYILQGFYGEKKAPKKTKKVEPVEPEGQDEPDKNRINAAVEASNRETEVVGERARQARSEGWRGSETVQERGPGRAVREAERDRLTRAVEEQRERARQAREQQVTRVTLEAGIAPLWRLVEEPEEAAVRERAEREALRSLQRRANAAVGPFNTPNPVLSAFGDTAARPGWAETTRTGFHGVIYDSPSGSGIAANADAHSSEGATEAANAETQSGDSDEIAF